jgi:hypothetical protein
MRENDTWEKVIYFELFGENCMKIIITGQIFFQIMHRIIKVFKITPKICMNFSFLGRKFKQYFELLGNFELQSFKLTSFYCKQENLDKFETNFNVCFKFTFLN